MYPGAKHFKREEWRQDPDRVSPVLVATLDAVRDATGDPGTLIHINQAWDASGHVTGSGHYADPATAVDFVFRGLTYAEQFAYLVAEPRFTGIGFYPDWSAPGWHGDIKDRPTRTFWVRRKGVYAYFHSAESLAEAMGWKLAAVPQAESDIEPNRVTLLPMVATVAGRHNLPTDLAAAMVLQESTWNRFVNRFEKDFYKTYIEGKDLDFRPRHCLEITEALGRATSWGLLQVMGATARQYGFRGWFPELCEAESGLEYGCCYLADLRRQFGQEGWPVVVRAYNGGPGGRHEESNPYPGEVLEKLGGRWPDVPA